MFDKNKGNEWISQLSPYIFWDTRIEKLDTKRDKNFIIERIADYGIDKDVDLMFDMYTISEIKRSLRKAEWLFGNTISYFSLILKMKKEKFRCYGKKPPYLL